jgi:hypothetical protein
MVVPKGDKQRRLHKALLRHDPANWPLIRQALETMGKAPDRQPSRLPGTGADDRRNARSASPEPPYPSGADQAYADCAPALERRGDGEEARKTR